MSWKIYNGFTLKNITKLEDALEYFKSLLADFTEEADDYWRGMIISHAIAQYDNDCAENTPPKKDYIDNSLQLFWDEERQTSAKGYKSITDVRLGLSIAPVTIKGKKRIIGMIFCDNKRLYKKFFELSEIEDYAWYDNTDKPEEISTLDWNYRGKVWKKLFEQESRPNKVMFGYDIISDVESIRYPKITQEHFTKYMVPFEDRVKGAINERLIKNKSFSNLSSYWDYIKSDEAQEAKKLIEPIVRDRLTINIALKDLVLDEEDYANE